MTRPEVPGFIRRNIARLLVRQADRWDMPDEWPPGSLGELHQRFARNLRRMALAMVDARVKSGEWTMAEADQFCRTGEPPPR